MRVTLEVLSVVLIVPATFWIISLGVYWLFNKGELASVPIYDRDFKPLSEEAQGRLYKEGVVRLHRYYFGLRRGFPWALGVLVVGVGLAIASAHISG